MSSLPLSTRRQLTYIATFGKHSSDAYNRDIVHYSCDWRTVVGGVVVLLDKLRIVAN